MAGTCSLVASRTARPAPSAAPLSLPAAEPITSALRESVEPSVRPGTLRADTSWVGAGFSPSPLFAAAPPALVLPGNRGNPIKSDASSAITTGPRRRRPFGVLMVVGTPTRTHRRRTPPASSSTFPTLCSTSISRSLCLRCSPAPVWFSDVVVPVIRSSMTTLAGDHSRYHRPTGRSLGPGRCMRSGVRF